jgi:hypothetical protein
MDNAKPLHLRYSRWEAGGVLTFFFLLSLVMWPRMKASHFWMDECLTWALVQDPSYTHMLRALAGGVDGSFPMYPSLAWLWTGWTGLDEVGLRSLSLACSLVFGLGWWHVCRRSFGPFAAACAVVFYFVACPMQQIYWVEARPYAMMQMWMVLVLLGLGRGGWILLVGLAALALTHLFGLAYAGWAALVRWRMAGKVEGLKAAGAVAAGALWLPGFMSQKRMVEPHNWPSVPGFGKLWDLWGIWLPGAVLISLVALFSVAAFWLFSGQGKLSHGSRASFFASSREVHYLLLWAVGAGVFVFAVWFFSRQITSLFVWRYMLPTGLGVGLLLAWICGKIAEQLIREEVWIKRLSVVIWLAGSVGLWMLRSWTYPQEAVPERSLWASLGASESSLPIVFEYPLAYLPFSHRNPDLNGQIFYLLDVEMSKMPEASRASSVSHYLMSARRHFYPELPGSLGVEEAMDFLSRHGSFLVVDDVRRKLWFDLRIQGKDGFQVEKVESMPGLDVYLVKKIAVIEDGAP